METKVASLGVFSVQSQSVNRHEWRKWLETFRIHDDQSSYYGALFQNQCVVLVLFFFFLLVYFGSIFSDA